MLEMLISPQKAERNSWEMFFIGLVYASLSIFLVNWIFGQDVVLSRYSGILLITFTVMFSMPFMYYIIRYEEEKTVEYQGFFRMLAEHRKAMYAFMWLFLGFVVAFSLWYVILSPNQSFAAQIGTYCSINRPTTFDQCVEEYGYKNLARTTTFLTTKDRLLAIFVNNIYVLIFTLVFSLIFGAGAIFILAWNASVIAVAVGIFSKANLATIPLGIARYMIHGVPEIGAYFVAALAGGIVSIAIIKKDIYQERFWSVMQDSLNLIIVAIVLLLVAALVEVYITPILF